MPTIVAGRGGVAGLVLGHGQCNGNSVMGTKGHKYQSVRNTEFDPPVFRQNYCKSRIWTKNFKNFCGGSSGTALAVTLGPNQNCLFLLMEPLAVTNSIFTQCLSFFCIAISAWFLSMNNSQPRSSDGKSPQFGKQVNWIHRTVSP